MTVSLYLLGFVLLTAQPVTEGQSCISFCNKIDWQYHNSTGRFDYYRGNTSAINFTAEIICKWLGYSYHDAMLLKVENDTLEIKCKLVLCSDEDVRLVGESSVNKTEGRVEVCLNGRWGTIQTSQPAAVAEAVCHTLDLSAKWESTENRIDSGGKARYNCTVEHPHSLICHNSSFFNNSALWVVCYQNYEYRCLNDGQFRLVNRSTYKEGRLEVCMNGSWGAVCSNSQVEIGEAVCSQMGFPSEGLKVVTSVDSSTQELNTYNCELTEENQLNCSISITSCNSLFHVSCNSSGSCLHNLTVPLSAATSALFAMLIATLMGWICTCTIQHKRRSEEQETMPSDNSIEMGTQRSMSYSYNLPKDRKRDEVIQMSTTNPSYDIRKCTGDNENTNNNPSYDIIKSTVENANIQTDGNDPSYDNVKSTGSTQTNGNDPSYDIVRPTAEDRVTQTNDNDPSYDIVESYAKDADTYDRLQYNQLQTSVIVEKTKSQTHEGEQSESYFISTSQHTPVTYTRVFKEVSTEDENQDCTPVCEQTLPGELSWGPQLDGYSKLKTN